MRIVAGSWVGVVVCLFSAAAFAHEHWVVMDSLQPPLKTETEIRICAGHNFPTSSQDTNPKVPYSGYMVQPDGVKCPLRIVGEWPEQSVRFTFATSGTYMLTLIRQRDGAKEPHYWSRTIMTTNGGEEDASLYTTKKDLEIVPLGKLSGLKKGDKLPLTVLYNGRRINALLTITADSGAISHIRTSPRRPALFKISRSRRYLVVAAIEGKRCSLTFTTPNSE